MTIASNKLRIAIIAHSLYPIAEPFAGGLEMITQLICNRLVALGHEVTLFAHADSQTKATLVPLLSREAVAAMVEEGEHERFEMTPEEVYQHLTYQAAMREIFERDKVQPFDVIHNHSLHHVPMLMGQAFGKRFFTTFHTPNLPQLKLALLTLQLGTDTQFTSVSTHQQQVFSPFVPSTVVYNGIEVDNFTAQTDSVADEVYFWFGRICPEKGTHLAMEYCRSAKKRLIIAGPKSNEAYFNEKVAPLLAADGQDGAPKYFDYVGHLTKAEINHYLNQATAMLFTSTWNEPYGLTLAESLACGTPVIGFDVGASAEIITEDTGIIVPKMDKESFIAGFDHVKNISRLDCRRRAEDFCSVEAMVNGYLQLYSSLADDSLTKYSLNSSPLTPNMFNNVAFLPDDLIETDTVSASATACA